MLGVLAYFRWARSENAMLQEQDMPYSPLLLLVTLFITTIALALAVVVIVG